MYCGRRRGRPLSNGTSDGEDHSTQESDTPTAKTRGGGAVASKGKTPQEDEGDSVSFIPLILYLLEMGGGVESKREEGRERDKERERKREKGVSLFLVLICLYVYLFVTVKAERSVDSRQEEMMKIETRTEMYKCKV